MAVDVALIAVIDERRIKHAGDQAEVLEIERVIAKLNRQRVTLIAARWLNGEIVRVKICMITAAHSFSPNRIYIFTIAGHRLKIV